MYKHAAKFSQQLARKEQASLSPSKRKKRIEAEARASKIIPKAALKARRATCPVCKQQLPKASLAVQKHFLSAHRQELTEAEAYRIASGSGRVKRVPYSEGLSKYPGEVSGGLPSLGKRR